MSPQEICNFCAVSNIASIHWGHAVNSQAKLADFAARRNIHVLEGDIQTPLGAEQPIMVHPPAVDSDISFSQWLQVVKTQQKGAKLDFKDSQSVQSVIEQLQNETLTTPLFLNADILKGPGGSDPLIDAHLFIQECRKTPQNILSVGWKTSCIDGLLYTTEMIDEMMKIIANESIHVTLPIRMCYLQASWGALSSALEQHPQLTLSLWNNEPVSTKDLTWMKRTVDPFRTFVDIVDMQTGEPIFWEML